MKVEIDDFKAVCTLVCSFDSVRNFIDNNSDYFNDKNFKESFKLIIQGMQRSKNTSSLDEYW